MERENENLSSVSVDVVNKTAKQNISRDGKDEKVCECTTHMCKARQTTVNSRYSGHPRDRVLVSVIARVRNSGVRQNFYFQPYLQERITCVFIFINSGTFFRPVVARKEHQNFIYKENRT